MEVSKSTKLYFDEIAERSQDYYDAIEFTKQYILDNEILDHNNIIDSVLLSILWCASKRNDYLTEEDVCLYLNVDEDIKEGDISVELVPEMKEWSLEEILEYVNGSCGTF